MTTVIAPLVSVWIIAALAWIARRALHVPLCPICAGVAGTWVWMLLVRHLGGGIDTSMLPLLMGGSVVGIAYQLDRFLPAGRSPMLWKAVSIPLGFGAMFALLEGRWSLLIVTAIVLGATVIVFFYRGEPARTYSDATVEKLEDQMKQCC